jgi:hypothetical protein
MATIKIKRRTGSVPSTLNYGELGIANNKIYFGNSSDIPIEILNTNSSLREAFLT